MTPQRSHADLLRLSGDIALLMDVKTTKYKLRNHSILILATWVNLENLKLKTPSWTAACSSYSANIKYLH